jgi:methionyl-tRNA synthetase
MPDKSSYYITTAISYPNGEPHIGHAYEAIATDAIARFHRLDGRDVLFLTGVDEHGLKMKQTAAKQGLTPEELAARNVPRFQEMLKALNISNDDFIRTTEPRHHESVAEIWRRMEERRRLSPSTWLIFSARRSMLRGGRDVSQRRWCAHRPQGTPVRGPRKRHLFPAVQVCKEAPELRAAVLSYRRRHRDRRFKRATYRNYHPHHFHSGIRARWPDTSSVWVPGF